LDANTVPLQGVQISAESMNCVYSIGMSGRIDARELGIGGVVLVALRGKAWTAWPSSPRMYSVVPAVSLCLGGAKGGSVEMEVCS